MKFLFKNVGFGIILDVIFIDVRKFFFDFFLIESRLILLRIFGNRLLYFEIFFIFLKLGVYDVIDFEIEEMCFLKYIGFKLNWLLGFYIWLLFKNMILYIFELICSLFNDVKEKGERDKDCLWKDWNLLYKSLYLYLVWKLV